MPSTGIEPQTDWGVGRRNNFDFIIVVLCCIPALGSQAALLRLLRLMRVLKLLKMIEQLQVRCHRTVLPPHARTDAPP